MTLVIWVTPEGLPVLVTPANLPNLRPEDAADCAAALIAVGV
jgi:hypothetical protein